MTARKGNDRPLIRIKDFKGLHTADSPYEIGVDAQVVATNVDVTRKNRLVRRNGMVEKVNIDITAGWVGERTMLYQANTNLSSVGKNYLSTHIRANMTPSDQLHAMQIGDTIYYSNGFETGRIDSNVDHPLGLTSPDKAILTAATGGELPLGIYQVAVTLVRSDGFESGVSLPATTIEMTDDTTAIQVGNVPSMDEAVRVNYYITRPSGDVFYFAGQGPTDAVYRIAADPSLLTRPMKAMNTHPPLPFSIIDLYNARMMYAIGDTIYFSDPFAYEQVNYAKGFIPFANRVTMIGVVEKGYFVGTTKKTFFLRGTKLGEMEIEQVADYGVVADTRSYLDGASVGSDSANAKRIPAWISTKGMCIGFQDGSVQNVSENVVTLPEGVTGASFFRQENGQNHFISVIRS